VALDHVGLNHLTWERAAYVDGTDALPGLIAAHGQEIAVHTALPASVMDDLGVVPSSYLQYFYEHDAAVAQQRGRPTRAEEVTRIERQLLEMYADPALDTKPELLTHRGGAYYSEAAVALLASLVSDARDRQVVNVRNAGTFSFLDDDAVIEVPAVVGAAGAEPLPVAALAPLMRGLVAHVSAYEDLAVDAAVRGGAERVRAALLAHPLVGQYDLAGRLADRLIIENARYLPWAGGEPETLDAAGR
jgi:6-phospho-beta-glucosidase